MIEYTIEGEAQYDQAESEAESEAESAASLTVVN